MSDNTGALVKDLILRYFQPLENPSFQEAQEYKNYLSMVFKFVMKILTSNIRSRMVDIDVLARRIQEKLHQEQVDRGVKFGLLMGKFNGTKLISKKCELLHLLDNVARNNQQSTAVENMNDFMIIDDNFQQQKRRERPLDLMDTTPDVPGPSSSQNQENSILAREYSQYDSIVNTRYQLTEQPLITDIIYNLQGVDGKYIKFDHFLNGYVVNNEIGVNSRTRDIVRKITECGWLYTQIRRFTSDLNVDSFNRNGRVLQAFSGSIEEELSEYYKFISQIETNAFSTSGGTTLRKILSKSITQLKKLKTLLILIEAIRSKHGGAILSTIHSFTLHGDPEINTLVTKILIRSCKPFYATIVKWCFEGILNDPHLEFFISRNENIHTENCFYWRDGYQINRDFVPCFMSPRLCKQIYRLGKSVNFLRECCRLDKWDLDNDSKKMIEKTIHDNKKFEIAINVATRKMDKFVLSVLKDKFDFFGHLHAIQKYILLKEGDFVQCLLKVMWSELDKAPNEIDRFSLPGLLVDVIRSSNAKYEEDDVLEALVIDMDSNSNTSILNGWSLFNLSYKLKTPLNNVFPAGVLESYKVIFKFHFKLQKVVYLLGRSWKKLNLVLKQCQRRQLFQIVSLLHPCTIFRHDMNLFLHNLQYFIAFDVIESEVCKLIEKTEKVLKETEKVGGNLDLLIHIHAQFPAVVVKRAFLEDNKLINYVLDLIQSYVAAQNDLYTQAKTFVTSSYFDEDKMDTTNDEVNTQALMKTMERIHKIKNEYFRKKKELAFKRQELFV